MPRRIPAHAAVGATWGGTAKAEAARAEAATAGTATAARAVRHGWCRPVRVGARARELTRAAAELLIDMNPASPCSTVATTVKPGPTPEAKPTAEPNH